MIDWDKPLRMKGTGTTLIVEPATGGDYWVMGHENGHRFKYTKSGKHIRYLNTGERLMPDLENIAQGLTAEALEEQRQRAREAFEQARHARRMQALEELPGWGTFA